MRSSKKINHTSTVKNRSQKCGGDEGEMKTLQTLRDTVFPKYCRYLMNVTLDSANGNSSKNSSRTEIDILFISTCGIILIENKELNGTLEGSFADKEWKFTAEKKNGHLMVKNPVLQNREHMKILNSIFTLRKTLYQSIAVVPEHTRLKINGSCRKNEYLVQRNELIPLISNIMESEEDIWTRQEVNKMVEKILLMKRFR